MLTTPMVVFRSIGQICAGHRALVLENLALRQQLAVLDANSETSAAPLDGPTVLSPPRQGLAGLALRLDHRAARYRGPMAPPMASQTLDPPLVPAEKFVLVASVDVGHDDGYTSGR